MFSPRFMLSRSIAIFYLAPLLCVFCPLSSLLSAISTFSPFSPSVELTSAVYLVLYSFHFSHGQTGQKKRKKEKEVMCTKADAILGSRSRVKMQTNFAESICTQTHVSRSLHEGVSLSSPSQHKGHVTSLFVLPLSPSLLSLSLHLSIITPPLSSSHRFNLIPVCLSLLILPPSLPSASLPVITLSFPPLLRLPL